MLVTRAGLAAACVAAAAAVAPVPALADADPASDFLPTQNVFLPYAPKIPTALVRDLQGATAAAAKSGYPIKVAIIASPTDLGGVPQLFNQPTRYAGYLGREISFNKVQPLLVVMPVGLGTYQAGPKATAAISGVRVGSGGEGLGRAALEAIQKLAAASGHPIRGFKPASSTGSAGGASALFFGVPVALLVLAVAILTYRRAGGEEDEDDEIPA